MSRITITLNPNDKDALHRLAAREFRDPRAQAALIIQRELERLGILHTVDLEELGSRVPQIPQDTLEAIDAG